METDSAPPKLPPAAGWFGCYSDSSRRAAQAGKPGADGRDFVAGGRKEASAILARRTLPILLLVWIILLTGARESSGASQLTRPKYLAPKQVVTRATAIRSLPVLRSAMRCPRFAARHQTRICGLHKLS